MALNEDRLLQMDHYVKREEGQDTSESFNGFTDSRLRGDESASLDATFHGYDHVFGLAEHASSLSLKQTKGGSGGYENPYRLYNTDVFEYDVDSPMALYGSIPFLHAHRKGGSRRYILDKFGGDLGGYYKRQEESSLLFNGKNKYAYALDVRVW